MKYLNEKLAWTVLGFAFDGPTSWNGGCIVQFGKHEFAGLCAAIGRFREQRLISTPTAEKMRSRFRRLPDNPEAGGFKWTRDVQGMKARAAFCRRQAAKR